MPSPDSGRDQHDGNELLIDLCIFLVAGSGSLNPVILCHPWQQCAKLNFQVVGVGLEVASLWRILAALKHCQKELDASHVLLLLGLPKATEMHFLWLLVSSAWSRPGWGIGFCKYHISSLCYTLQQAGKKWIPFFKQNLGSFEHDLVP